MTIITPYVLLLSAVVGLNVIVFLALSMFSRLTQGKILGWVTGPISWTYCAFLSALSAHFAGLNVLIGLVLGVAAGVGGPMYGLFVVMLTSRNAARVRALQRGLWFCNARRSGC